jgi:hypothetical protein
VDTIDMEDNMVTKEVSFTGIIKTILRKYAQSFIDDGTIMFNDANAWIEMEIKYGKGQGDRFEGAYAACELKDWREVYGNLKLYYDPMMQIVDSMAYFAKKSNLFKPAFCFFLLKNDIFEIMPYAGVQNVTGVISKEYFKDFAKGKSADEVENLDNDDKPSVIVIENYDEFVLRIKRSLKEIGVDEDSIKEYFVEYENKHIPFHITGEPIGFLKFKDTSFSHQMEG